MTEPFDAAQLEAMTDLLNAGVPTDLVIWATDLPYWLVEYTAATLNPKGE